MYKLGTLEEFNVENTKAKKEAGWSDEEIENGKIIIDSQGETYAITLLLEYKKNPLNSNEFLWKSENGDIEDPSNILFIWRNAIIKPVPPKYYIANNNKSYIYGKVESDYCVSFGSKTKDIEIFDTEASWFARLNELKIVING